MENVNVKDLEEKLKNLAKNYENIDTSDFQGILLSYETLYGFHYQELFNRVAKMIIKRRLDNFDNIVTSNPCYNSEFVREDKKELIEQLEKEFDCEIDYISYEIKFLYE